VHLHLNAGGGRYCVSIHDAREPGTGAIGAAIDGELRRLAGLTAPSAGSTWQALGSAGAHALVEATWEAGRAWPQVTAHALVVEAAFIDQPQHHGLFDGSGLEALGAAIARGLALAAGRTS
jgi:hypothetical protein